MAYRVSVLVLVVISLSSLGCTHAQLRRSTNHHIQTVVDIQHQQVLDNLARFQVYPDATPYFAVPGSGTTSVRDAGSGTATLTWNPTTLISEALSLNGSRAISENWSLTPINEPARLNAMRCAYQHAVEGYSSSDDCIDCGELFRAWHPDMKDGESVPPCLLGPGWYGVGCKSDIPDCACAVGNYCDTYVWITPSGYDSLNKMTMLILDYATRKIPTAPAEEKQEVTRTWSVDKIDGAITYSLDSVVTKTLEPNGELPARPPIEPLRSLDDLNAELNALRGPGGIVPRDDLTEDEKKRYNELNRQIEYLKNLPPATTPTPVLPQYRDFSNPFSSQIFSDR